MTEPPAVTLLGFTIGDDMMRDVLRREPTMPVQTLSLQTIIWTKASRSGKVRPGVM